MTNRVNHFSLREILSSGRIQQLRLQKSNTLKEKENLHTWSRIPFFQSALDDLNSAGLRRNSANAIIPYDKMDSKRTTIQNTLITPQVLAYLIIQNSLPSHIVFLKESVFFDPSGYSNPMELSGKEKLQDNVLLIWSHMTFNKRIKGY